MKAQAALKSMPEAQPILAGAAINLQPLRDSLHELEIAATKVADMQGAFSDLLQVVAKKNRPCRAGNPLVYRRTYRGVGEGSGTEKTTGIAVVAAVR